VVRDVAAAAAGDEALRADPRRRVERDHALPRAARENRRHQAGCAGADHCYVVQLSSFWRFLPSAFCLILRRVMRKFLFLFIAIFATALRAAQPMDAAQLQQALKKLTVVGSVMYVAAHPDDENTALIAYLGNERLLRTTYLSMTDRKSTRLNSSHLGISYAVFCL